MWEAVLVALFPEMAGGQPPVNEGISNPCFYDYEACR